MAPLPYDAPPIDAYWMQGRDSGMYRLGPSGPPTKVVQGGCITTETIAASQKVQQIWPRDWKRLHRHRVFNSPIEQDVRPVVVENLTVQDAHLAINDKWLITGPAGSRLLGESGRAGKRERGKPEAVQELNTYFTQASKCMTDLPLWDADLADLDFVIEARNLKNYFHFVRDTFAVLPLVAELENFNGRIIIVAQDVTVPAFVTAHINAFFPELSARIIVEQAPMTFKRAIIAHYSDTSYFHDPAHKIDDLIPNHQDLSRGIVGTNLTKILNLNSYTRTLRKLRETAHARIADLSFDHLPRRFWVGRRATPGHDRSIKNEAEIIKKLAEFGFETVYFEDLSPFEQVGLMLNADIMISYHGAGFTNMLYAGGQTSVIELGTLQTANMRLDDFAAFAHVSQADYTVAVADYPEEFGDTIPPNRGHGIYPVGMSDHATRELIAYVKAMTDA